MSNTGKIGGHHVPGYVQASDGARVAAVADVDVERARRLASGLRDVALFADYRDMPESDEVDAVDICLPHHLHKAAIVAAAAAGKHILCEKPLCLTLDQAAAVTDAVRESGVTLMCAHNQLFLPTVAAPPAHVAAPRAGQRAPPAVKGGGKEPGGVQEGGAEAPATYALEVVAFVARLRDGRRPLNTE